jgi:hypothetical protein
VVAIQPSSPTGEVTMNPVSRVPSVIGTIRCPVDWKAEPGCHGW